jgi:hypothetical protein
MRLTPLAAAHRDMLIAMNGVKYPPESPKNCVFCGNPFLLDPSGSHYVASLN